MHRTVPKHDLDAACNACGLGDIDALAERSGIPVEALRAFADGEASLSALDRLRIVCILLDADADARGKTTPWFDTVNYWIKVRASGKFNAVCESTLQVYDTLCDEVRRELEQEETRNAAT
jgi:hypothetical protein